MKSYLLLALALGTIYGVHIARASFVYEDARWLEATKYVDTWRESRRPRGLTLQSWNLVRSPQASHALNVGLHAAVVGLTVLLLWNLTRNLPISGSVAAIVAAHPLAIQGVAYAASRGELLAAGGALLALACLTAQASWPWLLVPSALAFAVGGKETGLVAVALAPLAWWYQGRHELAARSAYGLGGVGLLALGAWWTLARYSGIGEYPYAAVTPWAWAGIQAAAVYRLVVLSVAPFWLSVDPQIPHAQVMGVAAAILLAGLLEIAWRMRQDVPLATFGILWCAIVAAPRFIVRTPGSPFNEHQWYLALVGVACVLVAGREARRSPHVDAYA